MLQLYIAIALDLNPSLVIGELEVNAFLGCEGPIIVHHSHILNLSQKKKIFFDGIKMHIMSYNSHFLLHK